MQLADVDYALSDIADQRFALEDDDQNLEANYLIERRAELAES